MWVTSLAFSFRFVRVGLIDSVIRVRFGGLGLTNSLNVLTSLLLRK